MNVFPQKAWNAGFAQFSAVFFPIMPYGHVFSKFVQWPTVTDLNQHRPDHVQTFLSHNLCFVEQKGSRNAKKSFSTLYEPRIFLQGEINTRKENWHDFFNAMIWYTFPKTKSALNMRQFIAFDENAEFPWKSPPKNRTREQDFLTMFDEGGCILVHFQGAHSFSLPFLFGHGFYERIYYGDSDLSASTLHVKLPTPNYLFSFSDAKFNFENEIKLLNEIDTAVSKMVSCREYYKKPGAFESVSLAQLSSFLRKW